MLQSLSLNSIMKEGTDLRDRIICEDIPSCQKWLPDIIAAMRDGKCMMMTYQSFTKEAPSTFEISPYCLKYFKQRWYILARTEIFPEGYDPKDTFRKLYGVILDKGPVETVILRVEECQVKYYRTLPLHHSQEELESGDGYTDFRYRLVPTFDFSREILSKGMYAEVISPLWLRREIAEEMRQAARMYNDIPEDEE